MVARLGALEHPDHGGLLAVVAGAWRFRLGVCCLLDGGDSGFDPGSTLLLSSISAAVGSSVPISSARALLAAVWPLNAGRGAPSASKPSAATIQLVPSLMINARLNMASITFLRVPPMTHSADPPAGIFEKQQQLLVAQR